MHQKLLLCLPLPLLIGHDGDLWEITSGSWCMMPMLGEMMDRGGKQNACDNQVVERERL